MKNKNKSLNPFAGGQVTKDLIDMITGLMPNSYPHIDETKGDIHTTYEFLCYSSTIEIFKKIIDLHNKFSKDTIVKTDYSIVHPINNGDILKEIGHYKISNSYSKKEFKNKNDNILYLSGGMQLSNKWSTGKGRSFLFEHLLCQTNNIVFIKIEISDSYYYVTLNITDDNQCLLSIYDKEAINRNLIDSIRFDRNMNTKSDIDIFIELVALRLLYKINDDVIDYVKQKNISFEEKLNYLEMINF